MVVLERWSEVLACKELMGPSNEEDAATALVLRAQAEPPAEVFVGTVIEGTDRGAQFRIEPSAPGPTLIGQSASCAIRLSDRRVSRRHASLSHESGGLLLRDLGSSNGTFADGVRILQAFVDGCAAVRVGDTTLRFDRAGQPAPLEPSAADRFGKILGGSLEMRRLYPLAQRLAQANIPVVIEGETGTGKELLAEALHDEGPRAQGPYVVFDCTASPASLIESELFGHERGAFTGATSARTGVFEQAHKGTLLIDEIGDLPLALQSRLLRVIERGEFRRVGGDRWIQVDVRLLAATRRDLDREVAEGRFRDDLFHRLVVGRIELPPLRRRHGDIRLLALHFAAEFGPALPKDVLARWEEEPWPGNVRELRNAVARAATLSDLPRFSEGAKTPGIALEPASLVPYVLSLHLPLTVARMRVIDGFERLYVEQILNEHGGNVASAANAAGVVRRYFNLLRSRHRS